jgi:hypothetical protein
MRANYVGRTESTRSTSSAHKHHNFKVWLLRKHSARQATHVSIDRTSAAVRKCDYILCVFSKKRPLGTYSYVTVIYVHKRFVLHLLLLPFSCAARFNDCQGPLRLLVLLLCTYL